MTAGSVPPLFSSVAASIQAAAGLMQSASASSLDGDFADAALEMSEAKLGVGVASAMSRAQDEMFASTLDMLV